MFNFQSKSNHPKEEKKTTTLCLHDFKVVRDMLFQNGRHMRAYVVFEVDFEAYSNRSVGKACLFIHYPVDFWLKKVLLPP